MYKTIKNGKSRQWRIEKFFKGVGGRQCRHLSQMHAINYMPFMREKAAY